MTVPAGRVAEPFVDADDIADTAVAAFTEDGHVGQLYELTGPRLLTFEEAVREIAHATGREIRYVPVSMEQYKALLTSLEVRNIMDIANKTVLITGANRGIGRALVDEALARGETI